MVDKNQEIRENIMKFIVSGKEKDGSGDTGNNIVFAKSKNEAIKKTKRDFPTLRNLTVKSCG